jgi:hypothetical protein
MTTAQRIRAAALGAKSTIDMRVLLGYFTEAWVVVRARLPSNLGIPSWYLATEDERRMFLLFVAEALENP